MRRIFSFLLLLSLPFGSMAQQCGYDFKNMFILDIRKEGETKQAKGIQVYLVDINGKHILQNVSTKKGKGYFSELVPTEILPNKQIRIKGRIEFPKAEDYYVVVFDNSAGPNQNPTLHQAMVIYEKDTLYYSLPYGKSLNVCSNEIFLANSAKRTGPMAQEDGHNFTPIRIALGQKEEFKMPKFPLEHVAFNYLYSPNLNEDGQIGLREIQVYDYATSRCTQIIQPSEVYFFNERDKNQHLKTYDIFGDNPAQIKDIIFTTRIDQDPNTGLELIYRDYYLFNERKQQHVKWTALSEYPNVSWDENQWPIRTETSDSANRRKTVQFVFDGENWKQTSIEYTEVYKGNTVIPNAPKENTEPNYDQCLILQNEGYSMPPVFLVTDKKANYTQVLDTLTLHNTCDRSIPIETGGQYHTFFTVPRAIAPGRTLPAYFKFEENTSADGVAVHERSVWLKTPKGTHQHIQIRYFVAGANTPIFDSALGRITRYRGKGDSEFASFEVEVDEKGIAKAYGKVLSQSGTRVGLWTFLDSNGRVLSSKQYGKRFILQIANSDSTLIHSKPEIRENGVWVVPEYAVLDRGFQFYCTENTDSIRVDLGYQKADCAYDFSATQNNAGAQLYFLTPSEPFIHLGAYKIPIQYTTDQYVIIWNYPEFLKTQEYPIEVGPRIAALKKKFTDVSFDLFLNREGFYTVDLSRIPGTKKTRVLKALIEDPFIDALSSVVAINGRTTFADKTVNIVFEPGTQPTDFKERLKQHGFEEFTAPPGEALFYNARYTGELINQDYFEGLNALMLELEGIKTVYPNFHYYVDYDGRVEEIEMPYEPSGR